MLPHSEARHWTRPKLVVSNTVQVCVGGYSVRAMLGVKLFLCHDQNKTKKRSTCVNSTTVVAFFLSFALHPLPPPPPPPRPIHNNKQRYNCEHVTYSVHDVVFGVVHPKTHIHARGNASSINTCYTPSIIY